MKTELKTALHVGEAFAGYGLSEYIPTDIFLKKWNKAAVGVGVSVLGLMMKAKNGGNHIFAFGVGAALNGVLDGFGLEKY